jgi:uncharacterized protein YvpB
MGALIIVISHADRNLEPKGFLGLVFCFYAIVSRTVALFNSWFTIYALTNRRLIIEAPLAQLQSITGEDISAITRSGSDDKGTVMIATTTSGQRAVEQVWKTKPRLKYSGLYGIRNPGEVEALISTTLLSRTPLAKGGSA